MRRAACARTILEYDSEESIMTMKKNKRCEQKEGRIVQVRLGRRHRVVRKKIIRRRKLARTIVEIHIALYVESVVPLQSGGKHRSPSPKR